MVYYISLSGFIHLLDQVHCVSSYFFSCNLLFLSLTADTQQGSLISLISDLVIVKNCVQ